MKLIFDEIGSKEYNSGVKFFIFFLSCIYCIVRCELKKTIIFLGRNMLNFTKHFLRCEANILKCHFLASGEKLGGLTSFNSEAF